MTHQPACQRSSLLSLMEVRRHSKFAPMKSRRRCKRMASRCSQSVGSSQLCAAYICMTKRRLCIAASPWPYTSEHLISLLSPLSTGAFMTGSSVLSSGSWGRARYAIPGNERLLFRSPVLTGYSGRSWQLDCRHPWPDQLFKNRYENKSWQYQTDVIRASKYAVCLVSIS